MVPYLWEGRQSVYLVPLKIGSELPNLSVWAVVRASPRIWYLILPLSSQPHQRLLETKTYPPATLIPSIRKSTESRNSGAQPRKRTASLHKATACVQFQWKASASPRGRDKTPETAGSPIDQLKLAGVEQDCYPSLITQTHVAPAQELDD